MCSSLAAAKLLPTVLASLSWQDSWVTAGNGLFSEITKGIRYWEWMHGIPSQRKAAKERPRAITTEQDVSVSIDCCSFKWPQGSSQAQTPSGSLSKPQQASENYFQSFLLTPAGNCFVEDHWGVLHFFLPLLLAQEAAEKSVATHLLSPTAKCTKVRCLADPKYLQPHSGWRHRLTPTRKEPKQDLIPDLYDLKAFWYRASQPVLPFPLWKKG